MRRRMPAEWGATGRCPNLGAPTNQNDQSPRWLWPISRNDRLGGARRESTALPDARFCDLVCRLDRPEHLTGQAGLPWWSADTSSAR